MGIWKLNVLVFDVLQWCLLGKNERDQWYEFCLTKSISAGICWVYGVCGVESVYSKRLPKELSHHLSLTLQVASCSLSWPKFKMLEKLLWESRMITVHRLEKKTSLWVIFEEFIEGLRAARGIWKLDVLVFDVLQRFDLSRAVFVCI